MDGSAPTRLGGNTAGTRYFDTWGSFSPDGQRIVFTAYPGPNTDSEVWTSKVDGTDLKQITNDRRDCGEPKWSPDGQWIVFFSAKDRYPEEVRDGWAWDILLVRPTAATSTPLPRAAARPQPSGHLRAPELGAGSGLRRLSQLDSRRLRAKLQQALSLIDWRAGKWQRIMAPAIGSQDQR